jgi:uncharacterized protein YihD (DUF1040 family)
MADPIGIAFRDSKRIDKILRLISIIWHKNPDQRLGQLLTNYAGFQDSDYYTEDDATEQELFNSFVHYFNNGEGLG